MESPWPCLQLEEGRYGSRRGTEGQNLDSMTDPSVTRNAKGKVVPKMRSLWKSIKKDWFGTTTIMCIVHLTWGYIKFFVNLRT